MKKRVRTGGGVVIAGGVALEALTPSAVLSAPAGVVKERERSSGCVELAGSITEKRKGSQSCDFVSGVPIQRCSTYPRVEPTGGIAL